MRDILSDTFVIIILAIVLSFILFIGIDNKHDVWCDKQRQNVRDTGQQWTPKLQEMCGDYKVKE